MGSKQHTFPKIENLPPQIKIKLDAMLFDKKGVTAGAKFLLTLIEFPSYQSCYSYVRDYKAYLATAYEENKLIPPTLVELTKASVLEAVDITQKQAIDAAELVRQVRDNDKALGKVREFTALQEMTLLAFIQKERTLSLYAQEKASMTAEGFISPVCGLRDQLESTFTMFAKIAQLQMDMGIIEKVDTSNKNLTIGGKPEQDALVERFKQQQHLNDITTRALEIILEDASGGASGGTIEGDVGGEV